MINMLKVLMEKVDSRQDQMGNFSTETETPGESQTQMIEKVVLK